MKRYYKHTIINIIIGYEASKGDMKLIGIDKKTLHFLLVKKP